MENWQKFMLESNKIEGEDRLNPGDEEAFNLAVKGIGTLDDILLIHRVLGMYLNQHWVGELRKVNVRVGFYFPPVSDLIPGLMEEYIRKFLHYDSYEAHNQFETIHPFRDLNGRVGRLIWLSKAVCEGYDFSIPFLQKYYYQTLTRCLHENLA